MEKITCTEHLKTRLKIRKIPEEYPREIYEKAEQKFYDTAEETFIAVKRLHYNQKQRHIMIAYSKNNSDVEIITIPPITEEKIVN